MKPEIMNLPFTIQQFLQIFKDYNLTVWPMQLVLNLLALVVVFLIFKDNKSSDKAISAILAFFWLWMGIVYHIMFFSSINSAANIFGIFFILQALFFIYFGVIRNKLSFDFKITSFTITGIAFILYALIIYPVLGYYFGHVYPQSPTFGAPCPTTIFTFGILIFAGSKLPKLVFVIPLLWSLLGASAAINLSISEDYGLLIAGIVGSTLIMIKDYKFKSREMEEPGKA